MKKLSYKPSVRRTSAIVSLVGDISNSTILDLGCADGSLAKLFKKKKNVVYGVDISEADLKKAKKVLDQVFKVDLNQQKIPLQSSSVDLVICSEVIEHLLPGNKLYPEVKRILKKDGNFLLTTPNILYWGHRLQFLKGNFEYQEQGPFDRTHLHFYTLKTLKQELSNNGFKVLRENHVFAGSNELANLVYKFLPSLFSYQLVFLTQKL